jgi:hypothetical protein
MEIKDISNSINIKTDRRFITSEIKLKKGRRQFPALTVEIH